MPMVLTEWLAITLPGSALLTIMPIWPFSCPQHPHTVSLLHRDTIKRPHRYPKRGTHNRTAHICRPCATRLASLVSLFSFNRRTPGPRASRCCPGRASAYDGSYRNENPTAPRAKTAFTTPATRERSPGAGRGPWVTERGPYPPSISDGARMPTESLSCRPSPTRPTRGPARITAFATARASPAHGRPLLRPRAPATGVPTGVPTGRLRRVPRGAPQRARS